MLLEVSRHTDYSCPEDCTTLENLQDTKSTPVLDLQPRTLHEDTLPSGLHEDTLPLRLHEDMLPVRLHEDILPLRCNHDSPMHTVSTVPSQYVPS